VFFAIQKISCCLAKLEKLVIMWVGPLTYFKILSIEDPKEPTNAYSAGAWGYVLRLLAINAILSIPAGI
jgi:hypothetical protein